ncbi:hypothetical protein HY501_02670, partial [Candidatus Woesearchaeota archaeon]|nr:hypothetical protein [Candidatus Woesearchaeota archaeon]
IYIINILKDRPKKEEPKAQQIASQSEASLEYPETVTEIKAACALYEGQEFQDNAHGYLVTLREMMKDPLNALAQNKDQFIKELNQSLKKIAQTGKPIWYLPLDPEPALKGVRFSLENKPLLLAEFEVIKQLHDAGFTNIGIAIFRLTMLEQVQEVKKLLLESDLVAQENIDLGVVIDNPASAFYAQQLCEGVDFLCIDLDALAAQILALDPDDKKQEKYLNPLHPAVTKLVKEITQCCKSNGIEVSIRIGLTNPDHLDLLVRIGFDSIITRPEDAKNVAAQVSKAERKLLLKVARDKQNV